MALLADTIRENMHKWLLTNIKVKEKMGKKCQRQRALPPLRSGFSGQCSLRLLLADGGLRSKRRQQRVRTVQAIRDTGGEWCDDREICTSCCRMNVRVWTSFETNTLSCTMSIYLTLQDLSMVGSPLLNAIDASGSRNSQQGKTIRK